MCIRLLMERCGRVLAVGMLAMATGCGGPSALDDREDRDPVMQRATARKNAQDFEGAVALYHKALERKPGLARAHLQLGLIYDQQFDDQVRAIFHYQRYLEMRPDTEKRDIVEQLIRHAKLSFAASLPDQPAEAVREIAMLKQEIKSLREQLAQQTEARVAAATTTAARVTASAARREAAPAESVATPKPADTYVVQTGDTLSRIATKVYSDSGKWEVIYDANRNILPSPQSIRVGQTLVIPKQ